MNIKQYIEKLNEECVSEVALFPPDILTSRYLIAVLKWVLLKIMPTFNRP